MLRFRTDFNHAKFNTATVSSCRWVVFSLLAAEICSEPILNFPSARISEISTLPAFCSEETSNVRSAPSPPSCVPVEASRLRLFHPYTIDGLNLAYHHRRRRIYKSRSPGPTFVKVARCCRPALIIAADTLPHSGGCKIKPCHAILNRSRQ